MKVPFLQQRYIFQIGIILIPFLAFLNTNFHDFDSILIRSTFIIFIFTILAYTFLAKLISSIVSTNFTAVHFFLSILLFLFFFVYTFLKDTFHTITPIYNGEIAFLSVIFFLFLFYFWKNIFFIRFIFIYVGLCLVFNIIVFAFNIADVYNKNYSVSNLFFNKFEINKILKKENSNIYYVILDAALPIDKFDDFYQTNYYKRYKEKFDKLDYKFIENSKSSYNQTKYTFTSMFNLTYFLNTENYKSIKSTNLYPGILSESSADGMTLIKTLNKIQYEFKWIGTYNKNCELYNNDFCLNYSNEKSKKKISNYISYYVLYSFLKRSPLIPIYTRINNYFFKTSVRKNIEYLHIENNAIKKFLAKIDKKEIKKKNYFFLIHNQAPHSPYIFNSDCSINRNNEENWIEYKKNYDCALKSLTELIFWIDKNDPKAIVVIQSDSSMTHDAYPTENKKSNFSHYDIFNLIKVNDNCEKYLSKNIDQVNGVRLALSCAVGQQVNLLEKKKYFADFEIGNASIGGTFKVKEIKTFQEERAARQGK